MCGYIDKNNRHGSAFKCKNCGFELNADLNASRNIEVLGKSEYFRLLSASQSLRFDETPLTGGAGDQQQAPKLWRGVADFVQLNLKTRSVVA